MSGKRNRSNENDGDEKEETKTKTDTSPVGTPKKNTKQKGEGSKRDRKDEDNENDVNEQSLSVAFEKRLRRFFKAYDPTKIESIPTIIEKYGEREEAYMKKMIEKYGPEPAGRGNKKEESQQQAKSGKSEDQRSVPPPQLSPESLPMKERLQRMFKHYAPEKIDNLDQLLTNSKGKEEVLLARLVAKYGPEPEVQPKSRSEVKNEMVAKAKARQEQQRAGSAANKNKDDNTAAGGKKNGGKEKSRGGSNASSSAFLGLPAVAEQPGTFVTTLVKVINNVTGEKDKLCCITDKGELHLYSVRDPHSPAGNIRGTASGSSSNPPNPATNKNNDNKTKQTTKDTISDNNNNFFNKIIPLDSLSIVVRQDTFAQESEALLTANALASVTRKNPNVYPPLTVAEDAHISEVRKQHLAATASHYTTFILRLDGKGIDGIPKKKPPQKQTRSSSHRGEKKEDKEEQPVEAQEEEDAVGAPSFEDDPLAAMAAESAKAEKEKAKAAEKEKKDAEALQIQAEEAAADAAMATSVSTWPYLVLRVPQQDVSLFQFALKQVFVLLQERAFYKQLIVKKVKDELVESKRKTKEAAEKAAMEVRRSAARRELHALKIKAKREKHRNKKENLRAQKKKRGRKQPKGNGNRKRDAASEEHNATNKKNAAGSGDEDEEKLEEEDEKEVGNANKESKTVRSSPSSSSADGNNGDELVDLSDDNDDDDAMSASSTTTTSSVSSTVSTIGDVEVDKFLGISHEEDGANGETTSNGEEKEEEPFYKRMARTRSGDGSFVARLSSSSSALFPFSFLKTNSEKANDEVEAEEEEGFEELEIIRTNPFSPNEDVIRRALVQQQKLLAEAAAAEEEMQKKLRRKAKYGSRKDEDEQEEEKEEQLRGEGGSFSSPFRHLSHTTNSLQPSSGQPQPQSRGAAVAEEMLRRALDPSKLPTNVRVEEKIAGIQPKNFLMTLRKTLQHGPAAALFSSSFAPLSLGSAEKARRAAKKALQDRYELDEGPLRQRLTDFLRIVKPELISSAPLSRPPVASQTVGSTSNRHEIDGEDGDEMRDDQDNNKSHTNGERQAVNSLPNDDDEDDVIDGGEGGGATFIDALIGLYRGKDRALFDDLCAEFKREANLEAIKEALLAAEIAAEDIANMVAEDEEKMERAMERLTKYQKEQEEAAEAERTRLEAEEAAKREQEELAEAERLKAEDEAKLKADENVAALAAEETEKVAYEARMDEDHFLGWRESELYSQLNSRGVGDVIVEVGGEGEEKLTITIPNAFEKYLAVCTLLDGGLDDSDFFRVEAELYAAAAAEKEKAKKKKEEAGAAEDEESTETATTTAAVGTTIDDDVWNETDETLLENFKKIQLAFEKERSRLKRNLGDELFLRYTSRRQHESRTNISRPADAEATEGEAESLIGGGSDDVCIFGTDTDKEITDYFVSAEAEEDTTADHIGPTRKELKEDPDHVGHDPHFNRKKGLLETGLSKFIITGRRRIGRLAKHCSVPVLRRAFGPEWERTNGKDQETSNNKNNNNNKKIAKTDYGSPLPYLETVFAKEITQPPPPQTKKSDEDRSSNGTDPSASVLDHDNNHDNDLSSDGLRLARRELARVFKRRDEATAIETEQTKKGTQGKGSDQTELLVRQQEYEEDEGAGFFEEELQENFQFSNIPDTISFVLVETVEAGSDEAVVRTEDATTSEEAARGETLTEITTKKTTYFARVPRVVTVPNYLYLVKPLSVREKMRYFSSRRRSPIIDNYHHCINVVQTVGVGTEQQQQQYMYNYGEGELEDARDREREDYYNLYPPGTAEEDMAWYEGSLLYEDMRPPRHIFAENVETVEEGVATTADPPPPPTDDDDESSTSTPSSYSQSSQSTRKTGSDGRITVDSFSVGEYPHRKRKKKKLSTADGETFEENSEEDNNGDTSNQEREYDPEFWESAQAVDGLLQINHWDVANALYKTSRRDYLRKRLEAGEGISSQREGETIGDRERGDTTAESEADSSIHLDDEANDDDNESSLNFSISSSSASITSSPAEKDHVRKKKRSSSSSGKKEVLTGDTNAQNGKNSNNSKNNSTGNTKEKNTKKNKSGEFAIVSKQRIIPIHSTLEQTSIINRHNNATHSHNNNPSHEVYSSIAFLPPPNMMMMGSGSGSLSGWLGHGTFPVPVSAAASVFGPPLPLPRSADGGFRRDGYEDDENNKSVVEFRRDGNTATKGGFFSNLAESLLLSSKSKTKNITTILPPTRKHFSKNSADGPHFTPHPPKLGSLPTIAAPIIISDGLLLDMADDMLHFATNKMVLAAAGANGKEPLEIGFGAVGTDSPPEHQNRERENRRQDPFASATIAKMNIKSKLRREHALAADVAEVALLRQRIQQAINDRNALLLPRPVQQEERNTGDRKAPRVATGEKEIEIAIDNNDDEKEELRAFDQHNESLSPEPSRPPRVPPDEKGNEDPAANGFFDEQDSDHTDDDDVSPDGSIESCMLPLPPLNNPPIQFQPPAAAPPSPTPPPSAFPPPPYPLDTYGNDNNMNPKMKRLSSSVEGGSDVSPDVATNTNYDPLLEPLPRRPRQPPLFSASKNNGTTLRAPPKGKGVHEVGTNNADRGADVHNGSGSLNALLVDGRDASPDTILDQMIGVTKMPKKWKAVSSPSPAFSSSSVEPNNKAGGGVEVQKDRVHNTGEGTQRSGSPPSASPPSSNVSLSSWLDSPNPSPPNTNDDVF